jgi:hypothetical protein
MRIFPGIIPPTAVGGGLISGSRNLEMFLLISSRLGIPTDGTSFGTFVYLFTVEREAKP